MKRKRPASHDEKAPSRRLEEGAQESVTQPRTSMQSHIFPSPNESVMSDGIETSANGEPTLVKEGIAHCSRNRQTHDHIQPTDGSTMAKGSNLNLPMTPEKSLTAPSTPLSRPSPAGHRDEVWPYLWSGPYCSVIATPREGEHVGFYYIPDFGEQVRAVYRSNQIIQRARERRYGEDVARMWKRGSTPTPAREASEQERKRRAEEIEAT